MKNLRKKSYKFLQSFVLTAGLIVSSVSIPVVTNADTASNEDKELHRISRVVDSNNSGLLRYSYEDENGNEVVPDMASEDSSSTTRKMGTLPSSYSLVDKSLTTSIKDQGDTGACWAFSAIKAVESNSIIKGLYTPSTADFSENHLAWFTYSKSTKKSDPMYNEGMYSSSLTGAYDCGGNALSAIFNLAKWSGAELEENAPFKADTTSQKNNMAKTMKNKESLRYSSKLHLQNADCYDNASIDTIKKAIMTKGALNISMYYKESGFESLKADASSYYQTIFTKPATAQKNANHCVTIVGWDDNYSKNNFKKAPSSNGAWLIANSYGTDSNDKGYFWMSYKEPSIGEIYSMDVESTDNYDNIYQYDGAGWENALYYKNSDLTGANVFTNKSNTVQYLNAVSFYTLSDKQKYTIKVYKNMTGNTPSTGTLVSTATTSGTQTYNGYHTVKLASPCKINPGEKFAVAVQYKYNSSTKSQAYLPIEGESFTEDGVTYSFSSKANQSFIYSPDTKKWSDSFKEGNNNICIKAFTTNSTESPDKNTVSNAKITLSRSSITLGKNENWTIGYKLTNSSKNATVKFNSNNTSVAKVSSKGKITATGIGKTTITATTSDGTTSKITVNVKKAPSKITTTPSVKKSIKKGSYFNIKYALPSGSASFKVTYSSSNKNIASVTSSGKVVGVKKGVANITIKTYNNKKSVIKVTVQ